jgi:hypothetical protein
VPRTLPVSSPSSRELYGNDGIVSCLHGAVFGGWIPFFYEAR